MSAGQRATIARMASGLTKSVLARKLGVTPRTIDRWEQSGVPAEHWGTMAEESGLLPSFFDVDEDDEVHVVEATDCNYRSLSRTSMSDRRRCEAFSSIVNIIVDTLDELVPDALPVPRLLSNDVDGDVGSQRAELSPVQAAADLRGALGLGVKPIANVVEMLESLGVVVVVMPTLHADSIDALSYWTTRRPVVLLNHQKKDPYRSRFDACHELGHLALGHGVETRAEPNGRRRRSPDQAAEQQANSFAGALLVPPSVWAMSAPRSTSPWRYLQARDTYGASAAALLYQAKLSGRLNEKQYKSSMVRYSQLGWRKGEPRSERTHERPSQLAKATRVALAEMNWTLRDFAGEVGVPLEQLKLIVGIQDEALSNLIAFPAAKRLIPDGPFRGDFAKRPVADMDRLFRK